MTRLYGRAPQGERLVDKVPHGHWKTTTFICGLRSNGVTAPFMLDGAMDGPHFLAYVEQMLAPTLKKGDIVSWTMLELTWSMAWKKQSRPGAHAFSTFPLTAQTSILSNNSLRN